MRISTACGFMGGVLGYTIGSSASCVFLHSCRDRQASDTSTIQDLAVAAAFTCSNIVVGFRAGQAVGYQIEAAVDKIWRQIRKGHD